MSGETIRRKLKSGERIYGTHVVSLGNPIDARIKTNLKMDFVFICTEHMPIDRTEVSMMCLFYKAHGISPIVRIPYPDPHLAAMALDAGAEGIVAPYVETVEQVKDLVGAVRWRPLKGKLLDEYMSGRTTVPQKLETYIENFNRNNYLIIGIESTPAIEHLDELLAFDGVDGVFLGPHDITCSMGIPEEYSSPEFLNVIGKVIRTCRAKGKGCGLHYDNTARELAPFIENGMNFLINAADTTKMVKKLNDDFDMLRESHGDIYEKSDSFQGEENLCITSNDENKE